MPHQSPNLNNSYSGAFYATGEHVRLHQSHIHCPGGCLTQDRQATLAIPMPLLPGLHSLPRGPIRVLTHL
jgi:hypothetical protein